MVGHAVEQNPYSLGILIQNKCIQQICKASSIPGITCTMPEGAFYAYPNVSGLLKTSGIATPAELTSRLLHEAGVVVVPGEAFGTDQHIRFSYAVSHKDVEEGLNRLRAFAAKF